MVLHVLRNLLIRLPAESDAMIDTLLMSDVASQSHRRSTGSFTPIAGESFTAKLPVKPRLMPSLQFRRIQRKFGFFSMKSGAR